MSHMENTMGLMKDDIVESILKLLQISEEKILKGDDVDQGTQEDKYIVPVDPPFINKDVIKEFNFNAGNNQGQSTRGI